MSWSTAWLIIQVVLSLLPKIISYIEAEKQKQVGRDEVLQAVLERFEDVNERADKARDAARSDVANGVHNDQFRRD